MYENNTMFQQDFQFENLPITWAQDRYIDDQYDRVSFELFQDRLRARQTHGFTRDFGLDDKLELQNSYVDFVMGLAQWKSFITLTFRDPVGGDVAFAKFRSLVKVLNRKLFGNHYSRKVCHSYFSYCLGVEYQRRDVIHFHVLVDRPVDYQLIQSWWNAAAGFVWIDKIDQVAACVSYVTKYMTKDGEVFLYKSTSVLTPLKRPIWWT